MFNLITYLIKNKNMLFNMVYFDIHLSSLVIALLGGALLCALVSAVVGMMPMRRVARRGRRLIEEGDALLNLPDADLPSVSVVVYAHNAEASLPSLVERLESQNYPRFEIIIVNDASADMTREVADTLRGKYDNIKYTFVSDTAKNVSRVKVAYTLGVKAADNDIIVTTAANAHPVSDNWLRLLCAPFADPDVDLSLGYAFVAKEKHSGAGKWARCFDTVTSDAQWLGSAAGGHAFRGDQYNMAFRRSVFFDHKGYAASTALKGGHDDVFVREIASEVNTAVALHPDSHVELDWEPSEVKRLLRDDRERRVFMARFLHSGAYRLQGLNSICIWLMLACVVAAVSFSAPNMFPVAVCAVIVAGFWGYGICLYRRTARLLRSIKLWWSVPLFWMLRPFASANRRQHANSDAARHYTWAVGMKNHL